MIRRSLTLSKSSSFFLFGARGVGKTTYLHQIFSQNNEKVLWIDLLSPTTEDLYFRTPEILLQQIEKNPVHWVVIDEVQKVPRLLDVVHQALFKKMARFALTGSSARKLKRGQANLLAGRAHSHSLFPFSSLELGKSFDLDRAMCVGTLPMTIENNLEQAQEFLRGYIHTYMKEEVFAEQLVRKVDNFRGFLPLAAQMNGQPLNFSKIAKGTNTDDKTVRTFFEILNDTYLGFFLPAFHHSLRKRQTTAPKFYFFDPGVKRALDQTLRVELVPETFGYGRAFEHWVILEVYRMNETFKMDWNLSYARTKDGVEIDLIIERPGKATLLIEIKSTSRSNDISTSNLERWLKDWPKPRKGLPKPKAQVWSQDRISRSKDGVEFLSWNEALSELIQS